MGGCWCRWPVGEVGVAGSQSLNRPDTAFCRHVIADCRRQSGLRMRWRAGWIAVQLRSRWAGVPAPTGSPCPCSSAGGTSAAIKWSRTSMRSQVASARPPAAHKAHRELLRILLLTGSGEVLNGLARHRPLKSVRESAGMDSAQKVVRTVVVAPAGAGRMGPLRLGLALARSIARASELAAPKPIARGVH